ncbi:hypothetical protein BCR37DRAFT_378410 [Protomyces lactucae-debilis]|uniref:RING-type E3 ubiquitin transferase n=1 Tax=Protomyces lactucae-debilis TaxID=2754530 RepID=A0A1Y2FM00_PROLT|nr:uncharacterized protein BCR37DRAFT_378410 [Protomyces lactucae-debilis]ORY84384.1 hypothetical protein BCR37DRAFT_378410 [Protomyces lactucae-debilis]
MVAECLPTRAKRKRVAYEIETCSICLEPVTSLALCQPCNHGFDTDCILRWTEQGATCPLCKTPIEHVSYRRHGTIHRQVPAPKRRKEQCMRFSRQRREMVHEREQDPRALFLERQAEVALQRRRYVYAHQLSALYVGANPATRFKSFGAAEYKRSASLQRKAGLFLRRELQCFPYLQDDWAFIRDYIMNGVLPQLDIQSAGASKLVGDLMGRADGDRLLHELHCFLRSPFDALPAYDLSSLLQYSEALQPAWPVDGP